MKRKTFTGFLIAAVWLFGGHAVCAEWLVTPKEAADSAAQYKKYPGMSSKAMPVSGAPEIRLVKPSISAVVKTPVDIQLFFHSQDGAGIAPSSFRVLYGFFGVDITSRILKYGVPTEDGIKVNHAELPRGDHHLVVQVADKRQRQGQTEIDFQVD